ncbi:50S ribosomal protein L3 [Candidatus Kuenenbacteria bacterium RIFCSPLOWO2_12_FULL_42_13]|uniref:Large ribosomal subunit protein uL3 n=4 Tax=Candidatus Kueneniibacteriota TaxID=1752740 RepID=A0A1F6G0T7_9BACT|nr:MAG: 50S ribosomal protein L3 [Candidatus Kuenenbacteria bacterium RIFCSPHIGHO2_02_FULL_42_29]OGG89770.1 MAG: 50S ribosomal protein L3 [Candidatus Kuenenbacteria bacterium RIFCSPLOWO2_02_FULL_42_16]OGG91715.1 MAG: 50S ribosomal protein L3 [Candidatus Kuenenbacteria bacterium RIFCSPLOWO2_12_FULL_42_13]OGH01251.1 MAG: 50S ribosomal protein L3 [Candidatus Kuenenbacteria bacterium RIFCSPHIGHO2_12_FULL_42_14]
MKFILGQKNGMTQIFTADGVAVPVTVIKAAPCSVIRVKTKTDKDGYNATVIGMPGKKKLGKRALGQTKGLGSLQYIKEFRADEPISLNHGDLIKVDAFTIGEKVKITGFSKGKGFQGVVKRHHFHGHDSTHGTKDQVRTSGSIGPCEPARVFPGVRMPGHMGAKRISVKNLTIAQIDKEKNLLYVKGAVPGAKNGLLMITCPGELNIEKPV